MSASGFEFFAGGDFAEVINPDDREAPCLYDLTCEAGYTIARGYDEYLGMNRDEDKVLLKKQLENLGVNSFKADKTAVREKHQNHESASKKKSCAWIFDVKAAPKQKK